MSNWKIPVVAFFALLSLSPTAFARTHFGTVVLTDGQRIEQAHYKVKPLFELVEITQIDTTQVRRQFKFDKIDALYDKNGKDVTRKYLGKYARVRMARLKDSVRTANTEQAKAIEDADWDSPRQRRSAAPAKPRIKLWDIAGGVGSTFSVPNDRFIGRNNLGFGFDAKVIAPINSFLALRGTVSHSTLHRSPTIILSSASVATTVATNNDDSRSITRLHLAAQYYFYNRRESYPPSFVGFIYTGAGTIIQRDTYGYFSFVDSSATPVYVVNTNTTTNFLSSTGVGFDAFLTPRFGLEFGINLDVAFLDRTGVFDPKYGYIFDFRLGALMFF